MRKFFEVKYCNDIESKKIYTEAGNCVDAICFVCDNHNVDMHDIDYCNEISYAKWWFFNGGVLV